MLAGAADRSESPALFTSLFLPASLLLCLHTAIITSSKNMFLHLPFSITRNYLLPQLSITLLTCFELSSFPYEAGSQLLCSFIY